ncbi:MAG TPA: ATP synthase F0 subunit B [Rikenellaceae bacterium]|nr:ATP synthase F0 subunit B [Rikenellaceae bacterium]HBH20729.1 ATP synthase F0 subunit B [Rikenellaceae bacterium]HCZ22941.1 ATP synthase F0 subunit B [Rikenellaceae bacterium]
MSLITPDFGLLVWMTLIFAIVFFILAKFGFPAITSMVDKRSARIEDALKKADEAQKRLSSLAQEHDALIEKTKLEQSRMLKEASQAGERIIASAKQQAQEEAAKIMEHAKMEIQAERESAMRDICSQVSMLSLDVAEKVIRKSLEKDEEQVSLVERLIKETESVQMHS